MDLSERDLEVLIYTLKYYQKMSNCSRVSSKEISELMNDLIEQSCSSDKDNNVR